MLRVGLTGGIGCGKSVAVGFFKRYNVPVIDADLIAAKLVQPGEDAVEEIASSLGGQYLLPDGSLNRLLLKEKVFNDDQLLNRLESILHPRIRSAILREMDRITAESADTSASYLIADIPLLVEKDYQNLFDEVIVVDCLQQQQIDRTMNRDQMDEQTIKNILSKQASREERLEIATKTLDNSHSIGALEEQVKKLHQLFSQPRA